jgi:putative membrane protein
MAHRTAAEDPAGAPEDSPTPPPVTEQPPPGTLPEEASPPRSRPVLHLAQGLLMGTADVVPGVSGGTIALIVGIYERLIDAVRMVTSLPVALVRRGPRDMLNEARTVEWAFVLPLGVGILTAIAIGARVIPPLMEAYPAESRALFFGLVAASLAIPWRRAGRVGPSGYALAAAAGFLAFVLVGLPAASTADPSLPRVFASAAVAICAMILPGVSGSFLLLVLGVYEATLEAVRSLDVTYISVFALGAIVGLSLFARLLSWLLHHHPSSTMVVLVGLLAGSLRALWPWQGQVSIGDQLVDSPAHLLAPPSATAALSILAIAVVGFAIVAGLTWMGSRKQRV